MGRSRLQEPSIRELAETCRATQARIVQRIEASPGEMASIVEDELRGLYHGMFVVFDGGTTLADEGLVSIVDEDGEPFDRFLHEICFAHRPAAGGAMPG